ncbi:MAG: hypothetical protein SGILL_008171, partial [Bacillariaceae sp.]
MADELLAALDKLAFGNFFCPWPNVWDVEEAKKIECQGKFQEISRKKNYYVDVESYKNIVEDSQQGKAEESAKRPVGERIVPLRPGKDPSPFPQIIAAPKVKATRRKAKKSSSRSQSSDSSPGPNDPGLSPAHNIPLADFDLRARSNDSLASGSYRSASSSKFSIRSVRSQSMASVRSQSQEFPDFAGRVPSTRAHMIPNPDSTDCYRYYTAITQAVLGLDYSDTKRMERIARSLAESDYNFLRAPNNHRRCLDIRPCWILTPGCTLQYAKAWKPGQPYPVLAMARGCADISDEEAYLAMSTNYYNAKNYATSTKKKGTLKTSKCTSDVFENATANLRTMVLAMAETLVGGKHIKVRPDANLHEMKEEINDETREYITKKLKDKLKPKDERSSEEDFNSHIPAAYYDAVQFELTRESMAIEGIKVPKVKDNLVLDSVELLQFEVDPASGLDLYPDPLLLLIKAAINWSWFCGQTLLPACGLPAPP